MALGSIEIGVGQGLLLGRLCQEWMGQQRVERAGPQGQLQFDFLRGCRMRVLGHDASCQVVYVAY